MVCFCTVNDYRTLYAFLLFTAFFPYRSTVLFPPAGWEKKERKGKNRTGKRYQLFSPQGYGGSEKAGLGTSCPSEEQVALPGGGRRGAPRGRAAGAAACPRPPALPATPPRPRRALGSPCGGGWGGENCGGHRCSAAGAAEGRRDGGMDG